MNIFTLMMGIMIVLFSIAGIGFQIYDLCKTNKRDLVTWIILFSALVTLFGGLGVTIQEIEEYRNNPINNQPILGEDSVE